FDVPKAKADTIMDEAEKQLQDLAKDIDESGPNGRDDERDDEENDNIEGWVDEMEQLPACECQAVRKSIGPIRFVLVKLRKLAFKIIHSTTKLLPAWYNVLNKCKLSQRIMPRDVATRWNSTFDMLTFALEYREAIDIICADKN
ncbi:hypothetical protein C8R48DRAFT_570036, partial [Suillus tomentosus]